MLPTKRKSILVNDEHATPKIYKGNSRSLTHESTPSFTATNEQEATPKIAGKRRSRKSLINQQYSFKSPCPQQFSMPKNIIYYIARNSSTAKCHQNLIMSCKLLFRISKIIPIQRVQSCQDGSMNITLINEGKSKRTSSLTPIRRLIRTPTPNRKNLKQNKEVQINLENLSFCKLWIHEMISINKESNPNLASTLVKHISKCSHKELTLCNQVLTFNELQILTTGEKLRRVYLDKIVIKEGDGSLCDFEKVFQAILCEDVEIKFPVGEHGIGEKTSVKMVKVLETEKEPCYIQLKDIPETFDFSTFSQFLKANMLNAKHTIDLDFINTISVDYKKQLQHFIDEIIESRDIPGHAIPYIQFNGQNNDALKKLYKMRYPHSG